MANPATGIAAGGASFGAEAPAKGFAGAGAGEPGEAPFLDSLKSAMDDIASMQSEADGKVAQLLSGNGQDVHSAMIAVEKANLSFQMMVQVRNKIVQAYQQISAMPF